MNKSSGILLHISELPGEYGIGKLGKSAYEFIDFLQRAGQSYWQVLPLVPTGYGDSPYQSCCSYAGNEYFIDYDSLLDRGLLFPSELEAYKTEPSSRIDYERLFHTVPIVLRKAFDRFDTSDAAFTAFVNKGEYADYALYRVVKAQFGHVAWNEWPEEYARADKDTLSAFAASNARDILFWQWCQFEFAEEWQALKNYAHSRGINMIGDMPIYLAYDSVECWLDKKLTLLGEDNKPTVVAGCPPDYFSEDGQLWGNPIYDWARMASDGYVWWIGRLKKCFELFDTVRIDHFRGFDRYYAIPLSAKTAKEGEWRQGPSSRMFKHIESVMGKMSVIGEDLGILDDSARAMFKEVGYPGMKILEYAFDDPNSDYLPHNFTTDNCIVYPGTHDNDTLRGFIDKMECQTRGRFFDAVKSECDKMQIEVNLADVDGIIDGIIEVGFASKAKLVLTQLQDIMHVGTEGRVNEPSTLSNKNWSYRVGQNSFSTSLADKINLLTKRYGRAQRIKI